MLRLRELLRAELLPEANAPPNLPVPLCVVVAVAFVSAVLGLVCAGFSGAFLLCSAGFLVVFAAAACLRFSFSLTYCFKLLSVFLE